MLKMTQKQSQDQHLIPQQLLLSKLLQLSTLSLEQRIKQEIEQNPLLEEIVEPEEKDDIDSEHEKEKEIQSASSENDLLEQMKNTNDIDWERLQTDDDMGKNIRVKNSSDNNNYDFQTSVSETPQEKLIEQLRFVSTSGEEQAVGEYIIWNLKDDGYFDNEMTLETIAHLYHTTVSNVEKILHKVQRLEPKAMGARNLRECLLIQLEEKFGQDELLAYDILNIAFEAFKNKKFQKVATLVDASLEEIKKAIHVIERLTPKPGEGYFNPKNNYIIPDFIVERDRNNFVISLNESNTTPLQISNRYKNILGKNSKDKKAKQFIKEKVQAAQWFINSIQQRKMTMLKIMNAIIAFQYDFFDKGPSFINPLIMKEVAERTKMDISTVSRVVNGKYVQTEYGIFELRSFFTEKAETLDGETISTQIIKEKIDDICKNEDKSKPFSDEAIALELNKYGYRVARRTVAKYREQLGIPVARLRRKII